MVQDLLNLLQLVFLTLIKFYNMSCVQINETKTIIQTKDLQDHMKIKHELINKYASIITDSDREDLRQETLHSQFELVKNLTDTSHVQELGDRRIGKSRVGNFQGWEEPKKNLVGPLKPFNAKCGRQNGAPSREGILNF